MNNKNIQNLIEKFLDAETTLEEEQELYDFFAQEEISDELKPYQEMFRDYACIETIDTNKSNGKTDKEVKSDLVSQPKTIDIKPKINRWKFIGIAASVAVVFCLGISYFYHSNDNIAFAYVNGEKINDEATALNIGRDAVCEIFSNEDNASKELQDIFNPE